MSVPFGYYCSISDGIYFTPEFTHSGAISWSLVTNTGLFDDAHDCFAVDPFNPLNRQYVFCAGAAYGGAVAPREVYTRNGGSWAKILDIQQAETLSGVPVVSSVGHLQTIWCDPTVEGSVYVGYYPQGGAPKHLIKSLNYGATWTTIEVPLTDLTNLYEFQVYGNSIWVQNGRDTLQHSPDGGANWYQAASVGQALGSGVYVNPLDTTEAYMATWSAYDLEYHKYAAGAVTKTTKQAGSFLADGVAVGNVGTMHMMWIDPASGSHQRIIKSDGKLYYTSDKWTNKTETNIACGTPSHLTYIRGSTGAEANILAVASYSLRQVLLYDDEDDTTATDRSGVGGTAIAGTSTRYGLWVGYSPVNTGVHVFSVEEDDITDIYYHDGLGIPMFGDRSSWRDYDADDDGTASATPLSYYHAEDIRDEQPQRHNPWPAASGTAPVSDGSKWVATDIITQAEFDYSFYVSSGHCPVTLDADAALILDLQGGCSPAQEIGLDVQQPTYVFIGPSFMPPDEPTFRPMYIEELANVTTTAPITDGESLVYDTVTGQWINGDAVDTGDLHGHVINEDHSAECNGIKINFVTSNDFMITTTAVYLNGLRQRIDTHYTEDVTLDGITFITAPETDDELVIDYLISWEDWLAYNAGLTDSDDIGLLDSDGVSLIDSDG